MKALKIVPMEYDSSESVRIFLFLGDFGRGVEGAVRGMVGLDSV